METKQKRNYEFRPFYKKKEIVKVKNYLDYIKESDYCRSRKNFYLKSTLFDRSKLYAE